MGGALPVRAIVDGKLIPMTTCTVNDTKGDVFPVTKSGASYVTQQQVIADVTESLVSDKEREAPSIARCARFFQL